MAARRGNPAAPLKHSKEFARECLQAAEDEPVREWRIAKLFYAALHAFNHKAYGPKPIPERFKHTERREALPEEIGEEAAIDYSTLEQLSRVARYKPEKHPMTDSEEAEAWRCCREVFNACELDWPGK